jgi:mRNA interferase MazF
MDMVIKQFGVYLVNLDPTIGAEIKKIRPCFVISPDEMNRYLNTIIIVPLTSTLRNYPTRINCFFDNKSGQLALDQMRAIDKVRIIKKTGSFTDKVLIRNIMAVVQEMFEYQD